MSTEKEKTPRKRAALQVLIEDATGAWVYAFGPFDSRDECKAAIRDNGEPKVNYLIAEAEPKCIEEQTRVSRKLV